MSTDSPEPVIIGERVSQIREKADQAKEIKQRIEKEAEERARAERKDRAFQKLTEIVEAIDKERERLQDWVGLARAMDAGVDEDSIQATLDQLERELEAFTEKSYQDFNDAAGINDFREDTLEDLRSAIQTHADSVHSTVIESSDTMEDRIKRTRTALRIPDLGESGDIEQLNEVLQFLSTVQQGELPPDATDRWRRLAAAYDELELSLDGVQARFDLSDETISVIRRFLDDETVMLSELDSAVLAELQTFQEFNNRLAIRFKEET